MSTRRIRVVQWATGNIGTRALREVIRHPGLELAGVLVYDPAKNGVDAGVLCGEKPVGVAATSDRAAIPKLDADCVVYMPRVFDIGDVVALLEAGTNIVTTRGELFGSGYRLGEEARERVINACARGASSIYATGSSPGFISETLPFALLSLQRRVDSVEIEEFADMSRRDSPHLLFEQMGFGKPLDSYNPNRAAYLVGEFSPPSRSSPRRPAGRSRNGPVPARSRPRAERRRWPRASSRPARSPRSEPVLSGRRAAPRSCASPPTGTAPPTSSPRGTSGRRDGACACTATRHSTSTSRFQYRSKISGRSRPASPRIVR